VSEGRWQGEHFKAKELRERLNNYAAKMAKKKEAGERERE
jgi:hypothetical protein